MDERTSFFKGWTESLESLETRIEALRQTIDSRSKPHDVLLDVVNEIKELKAVSVDATFEGLQRD